jgi:Phosphotransferase enzyme family
MLLNFEMKTILDTSNVFEYLSEIKYCNLADKDTSNILVINAKNFNLAIEFSDGRHLLVKQERCQDPENAGGEFWTAWQMHQLVEHFPDFGEKIRGFLPNLLHFDPDNSILVVEYVSDYCDLHGYYDRENQFPVSIASSIGRLLGTIHRETFERAEYQQFLRPVATETGNGSEQSYADEIIERLGRITPQILRIMPHECLQFFKLYQRFPSLSRAIVELRDAITPSCLVHNDLKINNILLDLTWQRPGSQVIRLIDWENAAWGDPAFDLGCILGSYLEIWLNGLVISNTLSINESLQLATTPLELLQPSLAALTNSYLESFPTIIDIRPDYLDRAIQFAGLSLIQRVEITIDEHRVFGNRGIVMLQVAKQAICTPQAAMSTLFGKAQS